LTSNGLDFESLSSHSYSSGFTMSGYSCSIPLRYLGSFPTYSYYAI